MPHSLIVGMTESGKTTLAKRLLSISRQAHGSKVILLDPMNDPEYEADFRTTNPEEFLNMVWASESCDVVIDEAGDMVGRYDTTMQQVATKSRHFGHNAFFICQRGAQISNTVRAQCRHLFLFCSAKDDCKVLANEFNQPELLNANSLPQGHYYHASRFGQLKRGQLW